MTRRHAVAITLALCHLALVLAGAVSLTPTRCAGPLGRAVNWYSALSGADTGYGFFAPEVSPQFRAVFTLTDDAGHSWPDTLENSTRGEAHLRLRSVADKLFSLGVVDQEPGLARTVATSWAATLFARHPSARQVVVRVERYDIPSMVRFREGTQPRWQTVYEATFVSESMARAAEER
jgi:hypothetical protein